MVFLISKRMHAETVALKNYCVAGNTMIDILFYNLFDNIQGVIWHSLFGCNMQMPWDILKANNLKGEKLWFMKMLKRRHYL